MQEAAKEAAKDAGLSDDEEEEEEGTIRQVMPGETAAAAMAAAAAAANAQLPTTVRLLHAHLCFLSSGYITCPGLHVVRLLTWVKQSSMKGRGRRILYQTGT